MNNETVYIQTLEEALNTYQDMLSEHQNTIDKYFEVIEDVMSRLKLIAGDIRKDVNEYKYLPEGADRGSDDGLYLCHNILTRVDYILYCVQDMTEVLDNEGQNDG
jgi:hypothetical protein